MAKEKKSGSTLFIGALVAFAIIYIWFSFWCERKTTDDPSSYLNALFAGLAFVGLIVAILLQKEELELQRKELVDTRGVFKTQQFESSFFNLFNAHVSIVKDMDVRKNSTGTVINQGRDCFKTFYLYFTTVIKDKKKSDFMKANPLSVVPQDLDSTTTLDFDTVLGLYMETYNEYQGDLGHYFRSLYHLIKFVIDADEDLGLDKEKYITIVRAQLSSYELIILFYNGLGKYGKPKFAKLYVKYDLLKNLDRELLISKNDIDVYVNELNYIALKAEQEEKK